MKVLDDLNQVAEAALVRLPRLSEALTALHRVLDEAVRASAPVDRRLLSLDLENVVVSASDAVRARSSGRDSEALDRAESELMTLIMDMRKRAAKALGDLDAAIELHATVSAHHAERGVTPEDLTRQFRFVASAPAPGPHLIDMARDAPGILIPTPLSHEDGVFGRVSGRAVMFADDLRPGTPAPPDSVILPADAVIFFEEGEMFEVHSEGRRLGGPCSLPATPKREAVFFEAGLGGAVLHGPAVLRVPDKPLGSLGRIARDTDEVIASRDAKVRAIVYGEQSYDWCFYCMFSIFVSLLASFLLGLFGLSQNLIVMSFMLGTAAFYALPLLRFAQREMIIIPRLNRQELAALPSRIKGPALRDDVAKFLDVSRMVLNAEGRSDACSLHYEAYGLRERFRRVNGVNLLPAARIAVRRGQEPRIMKDLSALPAPKEAA